MTTSNMSCCNRLSSTMLRLTVAALLIQNCHADDSNTMLARLKQGPDALNALDLTIFAVLILLAFEVEDFITKHFDRWTTLKKVPVRGKHLDNFSSRDRLFILISKASNPLFVYLYLKLSYYEPNVIWKLSEISLVNFFVPLVLIFVVYDFFYTLIHWTLHIKSIYGYIHKHHHHQKAPSRGNIDAVNVHPIEYILGEYNHLFALYLLTHCFGVKMHITSAFMFLVIGGLLAGFNHTRHDIVISLWGWTLFDNKAHDVHHRIPQSNYGQYTMFWDHIFGSFRAYNPLDRINPEAQLDPLTGKTVKNAKI